MANKTQLNESTKYNIHKIEKGETLFSIASKYNTSIENIKQINQMANDSIKIGQEIKIPIDTSFLQNNQNNEDNYTFYTIQKGDTVWSIANKHNMELNELLKINNLANTNVVPGQKIKVKANK